MKIEIPSEIQPLLERAKQKALSIGEMYRLAEWAIENPGWEQEASIKRFLTHYRKPFQNAIKQIEQARQKSGVEAIPRRVSVVGAASQSPELEAAQREAARWHATQRIHLPIQQAQERDLREHALMEKSLAEHKPGNALSVEFLQFLIAKYYITDPNTYYDLPVSKFYALYWRNPEIKDQYRGWLKRYYPELDAPNESMEAPSNPDVSVGDAQAAREAERKLQKLAAEQALKEFDGNKTKASNSLGISRPTLYDWLGIKRNSVKRKSVKKK